MYLDEETSCSSSWDVLPPNPLLNALESCSSTDTSKNQSMMTWMILLHFSDSYKVALEKTNDASSSSATIMSMPVLDEQICNPVVCCGKSFLFCFICFLDRSTIRLTDHPFHTHLFFQFGSVEIDRPA